MSINYKCRLIIRQFAIFIFITICLCGCDHEKIFENNVKIHSDGWRRAEIARFEVEITDTISPCNVYVNVRNNNNYKYMNLWLFVDVRSPLGVVQRDTAQIILADHRGKWLGHGLYSKFDTRYFLARNIRFPVAGTYIIEYEQAMRDEILTGIDDIGLRIEKMPLTP